MKTPRFDSQNENAQARSDNANASSEREARSPCGVTAMLSYLGPTTVRPYNYMYEPPAGRPWQNCEYWPSEVRIEDARSLALAPSIHVEGFELRDAPSSMRDFGDEEAIRDHYYTEAAELAKHVTGADHAYVFDHLVRHREAGRPALSFGRRGDGSQPGAAGRVHNDYNESSGARRLGIESSNHGFQTRVKRFSIVNIWRSIGGKVVDTPLALCDARTVSAEDLVAADMYYPNRVGEIFLVHQSPHHRWVYFSEMVCREALVFKQYDSQVSGVPRFTPHCAFDLPEIPPDAPLRASIEIRCLVTYG